MTEAAVLKARLTDTLGVEFPPSTETEPEASTTSETATAAAPAPGSIET